MLKKYFKNSINNLLKRSKKIRSVLAPVLGRFYFPLFGSPAGTEPLKNIEADHIYEEKTLRNDAPKNISGSVHKNFVAGRKYPKAFVAHLNNGYSTNKGYNVTKKGNLVPETSYEYYLGYHYPEWELKTDLEDYEIWLNITKLPDITKVDKTVASLTTIYQSNYYHWLFDVLPRLHLLEKAGIQPDLYFVENSSKFQTESLGLLGIGKEKIINANDKKFIKAKNLFVPSIPGLAGVVPEWAGNFLRENLINAVNDTDSTEGDCNRIYISREKAKHRRVVNENELISVLENYNFEVVHLEEMSFSEQIRLFNSAECVVSPHGAGLANTVFCKENAKVLELFSPNYVNPVIGIWHKLCSWTIGICLEKRMGQIQEMRKVGM